MLKKTNPGIKFNPGLALIGVRTTGPDAEVAETSYQFLILEAVFFYDREKTYPSSLITVLTFLVTNNKMN